MIVDDHPVVRDGLRGMFADDPDFEVVGEARDGAEALTVAARQRPHVVLMDLRMPGLGGADAIRRLRAEHPAARVLVLTTFDSDRDVLPAGRRNGIPAQGRVAGRAPGRGAGSGAW